MANGTSTGVGSAISGFIKELITAAVSVVIVALGGYMLWVVFLGGAPALAPEMLAAYNRQKDILMLVLGLLGTVMGYYFGRVPAELRAQKAEQSATTAQAGLAGAHDKVADASRQAGQAEEKSAVATADAAQARAARKELATGVRRITEELGSKTQQRRATLSGSAPPPELEAMEKARKDLEDLLRREE